MSDDCEGECSIKGLCKTCWKNLGEAPSLRRNLNSALGTIGRLSIANAELGLLVVDLQTENAELREVLDPCLDAAGQATAYFQKKAGFTEAIASRAYELLEGATPSGESDGEPEPSPD